MPAEHTLRGAAAEDAALALLQQHGLVLLARNARFRMGELDLVMADGRMTVFVEVRHRTGTARGGALLSITPLKQQRLQAAARLWLQAHPARAAMPCRFDVVISQGQPAQLSWLRDAFQPGGY